MKGYARRKVTYNLGAFNGGAQSTHEQLLGFPRLETYLAGTRKYSEIHVVKDDVGDFVVPYEVIQDSPNSYRAAGSVMINGECWHCYDFIG